MTIKNQKISEREMKIRLRAGKISLIAGILLMLGKFWAFEMTHSQAVLSDALESIVNVIAAILALIVLIYASRPADPRHPYGRGKLEFFSAAFEGGLITFAAIIIIGESLRALYHGVALNELGVGLLVVGIAGVLNAILGLYLRFIGKKYNSEALVASGIHIFSDFWTSAGVIVGLGLVWLTGLVWLDPLVAILLALWLARAGIQLVRSSMVSLLDQGDMDLISDLRDLIMQKAFPGMIWVHNLRIIRAGSFHHIDAHLVIPEFWDVPMAHDRANDFEHMIVDDYTHDAEIVFHVDPCRQAYCATCDFPDCHIRKKGFTEKHKLTIAELTDPEEPSYTYENESTQTSN